MRVALTVESDGAAPLADGDDLRRAIGAELAAGFGTGAGWATGRRSVELFGSTGPEPTKITREQPQQLAPARWCAERPRDHPAGGNTRHQR